VRCQVNLLIQKLHWQQKYQVIYVQRRVEISQQMEQNQLVYFP